MKCDESLSKVRTGGLWKRLLARLHAARCGRCAALQNGLDKMEAELARTVPLTDAQRRLWEQAVEAQPMGRPRSPVRWRLAAVAAAAALVAVSVVAWQWIGNSRDIQPVAQTDQRVPRDEPGPSLAQQLEKKHPGASGYGGTGFRREWPAAQAAQEPPSISLYQQHPRAHESSQELAEIRAGLDGLSAKLDELSRKAALLKARRQVAELIDRYANLSRHQRD